MKDEDKTKEQLINELAEMRQEITALKASEAKQKVAEEALRQTEERYRTILESIEDGYYEVDIAGNHTFFNDSLCNIYGYTRDELMGMNNRDYMSPETSKETFRIFNKVYTTGKSIKVFDHEGIKKNGSTIYVEISISLMRDSKGGPVGFRGIVRDITERKRAEETLRDSEERYRSLVENIDLGVNLIDSDHNIVMVNAVLSKKYKKSMNEIIGKKCYRELEKRDAVCPHCPGVRAMATGQPAEFESEGVINDSHRFNARIKAFPTFANDGTVTGFIEVVEDITESKKAADALRESERRFRRLVEHSTDAFFLHEFDGRIIDVNQHSCESLGYTREELLGLSIQDIDQEFISGKHLEKWKQMVPGEPITLEGVHQRKDGTRFPVESRLGVFEAGERRLTLGLVRDITERKRAEKKLR
ncbi:MAG: PAS domain-containing protein, partial [Candidatus Hodarchaeota archaeon]